MGESRVQAREREFSSRRRAVDDALMSVADWLVRFAASHWLLAANVIVFLYAFLPFLSPWLQSLPNDLARGFGDAIFAAYSNACHQLPERSWVIFGHQMAYCERDAAIYPAMFLSGIVFALVRGRGGRTPHLGWFTYLALIAPMAIDGFTQLFGLRESTWFLRTITGSLFGAATVWVAYPYLQKAVSELEA